MRGDPRKNRQNFRKFSIFFFCPVCPKNGSGGLRIGSYMRENNFGKNNFRQFFENFREFFGKWSKINFGGLLTLFWVILDHSGHFWFLSILADFFDFWSSVRGACRNLQIFWLLGPDDDNTTRQHDTTRKQLILVSPPSRGRNTPWGSPLTLKMFDKV